MDDNGLSGLQGNGNMAPGASCLEMSISSSAFPWPHRRHTLWLIFVPEVKIKEGY